MNFALGNFFIPHKFDNKKRESYQVAAIVPSFKPGELTFHLVRDLLSWNKNLSVYVVNDSTPEEYEAKHRTFERISKLSYRVAVLKTPKNKLKAGAINYALRHIFDKCQNNLPDAIVTLDDDIIVTKNTITNLTDNLFEDDRFSAVCSQCRVINKNANFLTRLQGLEYLGFNGIRLSDEGFFKGPLVMHGMLSAFKTPVLQEVGFFAEGHLIEDYEITVRMKMKDWHVRLAPYSFAWTRVPEDFSSLWRQRVRWMVGGLFVVTDWRYWQVIIQDVFGHLLFISTFLLIIASFIVHGSPHSVHPVFPLVIIIFSLTQMMIWYLFQIWFMNFYQEKDWKDWLIRISLIPEFVYANVLAIILLGSYIFYIFEIVFSWLGEKSRIVKKVKVFIEKIFARIGYSKGWGTR